MENGEKKKKKVFYGAIKRVLDIIVSLLAIIVLFLPSVVFAIIIKCESKGPVFFKQKRVGKGKKLFTIYKFRTMCADAEKKLAELQSKNEMDGPVFKIENDPRITKIGKFLRASNIDELPQIFNIFLGDMSFVGPRPALPREVEQYRPSDKLRLLVTPGLTCYWQVVKNRNSVSFDEWMELDRKYIQERNVWIDIKLIFKTFFFLFKKSGC